MVADTTTMAMHAPSRDRKRAERLVAELSELDSPGIDVRAMLEERMLVPMRIILRHVPGETEIEKCAACGVSKTAWFRWKLGVRPRRAAAERLAKLTGFKLAVILGR